MWFLFFVFQHPKQIPRKIQKKCILWQLRFITSDGVFVGTNVGIFEGLKVGIDEGTTEGIWVGNIEGTTVGRVEGTRVGDILGTLENKLNKMKTKFNQN